MKLPMDDLTLFRNDSIDNKGSSEIDSNKPDGIDKTCAPSDANLVGSRRLDGSHALILDLDIPATLIPSTTPGHSHLYVDVRMSQEQLENVLETLMDAGVIQRGWGDQALRRKMTAVRTPWTIKQ